MPDDFGNPTGTRPLVARPLHERGEEDQPDPGKTTFWGGVNTSDEELHANLLANMRRPIPQLQPRLDPDERVLAICGGGPSLEPTLPELREVIAEGAKVVSLNGTHDWLYERGIKPSIHVMLDARAFNARFVEKAIPGCKYFIASQCHPSVLESLERQGAEVYLWHTPNVDEDVEALDRYYHTEAKKVRLEDGKLHDALERHWWPVGGGTSVGMRSIRLLRGMGFRKFHLFGLDGCYVDRRHHSYEQRENDTRDVVRVWLAGRPFEVSTWMVRQHGDWIELLKDSVRDGSMYEVHGDGLLAWTLEQAARGSEDLSLGDEEGSDGDVRRGLLEGEGLPDQGHIQQS